MLISPKHLPPNVSEQLSNEEVASALFPKIMDKSYQAPHDANSGWCQYIRPNGASFWVYVDDHGAVCIQTEAVRNAVLFRKQYCSMDISRVGSRTMVIGGMPNMNICNRE